MSFELRFQMRHRSEADDKHGSSAPQPHRNKAMTTMVIAVAALGVGHLFGVNPVDVLRAIS